MSTSEETSHTRILVLDDGREFRLVLGRLLDRDGYDVTCVGTLLEARGAVQGEQFDILVFDLQLPDGRGTALLSELRETPEYADTPAIAITAKGGPGVAQSCEEAGFQRYIPKPVRWPALRAVLRELASEKPWRHSA